MKKPIYCVDTSSFLNPWVKSHPHGNFPTLWEKFEQLVKSGAIVSPREVFDEMVKYDDDLAKFVKKLKSHFVRECDGPILNEAKSIVNQFHGLVSKNESRTQADPFVIAYAKVNGLIVVSEEGLRKKKIPQVCRSLGVNHLNFVGIVKEQNWKF